MTGVVFGREVLPPCVHCGAPLVGVDADDDLYVLHGTVEEIVCDAPDLDIPGTDSCADNAAAWAAYDAAIATAYAARPCCACGEPIVVAAPDVYGAPAIHARVLRCPVAHRMRDGRGPTRRCIPAVADECRRPWPVGYPPR